MKTFFLLSLTMAAFIMSCRHVDEPQNVVATTIITDTIPLEMSCVHNLDLTPNTGLVFRDSASFSTVLQYVNKKCTGFQMPSIDFNQRTVIEWFLFAVGGGGCSPPRYNMCIKRNDEQKTVVVEVRFVQVGICNETPYTNRWYSIPKIPSDYSISFSLLNVGSISSKESIYNKLSSGVSADLYDVSVLDSITAYAVGAQGTVLRTVNGGQSWTQLQSGGTTLLKGVWATSATTCFACGSNNTLISTSNGGSSWQNINTGYTAEYNDIRFVDSLVGFVFGKHIMDNGTEGIILRTKTGGSSWMRVDGGNKPELNAGYVVPQSQRGNKHDVWAVGKNSSMNTTNSNIVYSSNDGDTWESLSSPTQSELTSIAMESATFGNIFGHSGCHLLRQYEYYGGVFRPDTIIPEAFSRNDGTLQLNIYGLTRIGQVYYSVGESGVILKSIEGLTWFKQTSQTSNSLRGVQIHYLYPIGYAVGNDGTIIRITHSY
jgi:hypothetical protein